MRDRRNFLGSAAGIVGAGLIGGKLFENSLLARVQSAPRELPPSSLFQSDPDSYWAELRKQFLIPEDEVYLNAGTVGASPAPVLESRVRWLQRNGENERRKSRGLPHLGLRRVE